MNGQLLATSLRDSYNRDMKIGQPHRWDISIQEAVTQQKKLATMVSFTPSVSGIHLVAGVDVRTPVYSRGEAAAAVVVMTYPGLEVVDVSFKIVQVTFPYVPGLLSFREIPLLEGAFDKIRIIPDIVIVDGHGIAHPRRIGIASHLGLLLDIPTIGCAKSRLIGEYREPGIEAGRFSYLTDNAERIGAVVRTRTGTKPVFVSVGNKINLAQAISVTLSCCKGYRLPEPTRQAHIIANTKKELLTV